MKAVFKERKVEQDFSTDVWTDMRIVGAESEEDAAKAKALFERVGTSYTICTFFDFIPREGAVFDEDDLPPIKLALDACAEIGVEVEKIFLDAD